MASDLYDIIDGEMTGQPIPDGYQLWLDPVEFAARRSELGDANGIPLDTRLTSLNLLLRDGRRLLVRSESECLTQSKNS